MAQRLVPFLGYEDAAAAIDWLCGAFGATEDRGSRVTSADGTIGHAELDLEGATIYGRRTSKGTAGCSVSGSRPGP